MSDNMHGGIKMVAVLEQEQENLHQEFLLKEQPEFTHANFVSLWIDYKDVCRNLLRAQREYYLEQEAKRSEYRERLDLWYQVERLKKIHEKQIAVMQTKIQSANEMREATVDMLNKAKAEIEELKAYIEETK